MVKKQGHPQNKSWAIANNKQAHPNFVCTNANSFQLKAAATDGNEVMPNITEKAYETAPAHMYILYTPNKERQGINNFIIKDTYEIPATRNDSALHLIRFVF